MINGDIKVVCYILQYIHVLKKLIVHNMGFFLPKIKMSEGNRYYNGFTTLILLDYIV
jgi:hypothetical protein